MDSLKRALADVERKLLQDSFRETDILEEIDTRRKQIALQSQLIHTQKKERKRLSNTFRDLEKSLKESREDLASSSIEKNHVEEHRRVLQTAYVRHIGARRRLSKWAAYEFLLGARSLPELFKRRRVLTTINRFEEKYLAQLAIQDKELNQLQENIITKKRQLSSEQERIVTARRKVSKAEKALKSQQKELKQQQSQLTADLSQVRNDKVLLEKQRQEIQEALRKIEEMIASAQRSSVSEEPITGALLTPLKGSLPWPVQGNILTHFGMQKNRTLATVIDNPGIDISAIAGEEVACIAEGRVASSTWLRGFGNVIIVEHPGSFFSVYGHLQQLSLKRGNLVRAGQSLGTASVNGSNGTYRIHFELWEGKQKHNPLHWLAKR